jgi:hypothetical protein
LCNDQQQHLFSYQRQYRFNVVGSKINTFSYLTESFFTPHVMRVRAAFAGLDAADQELVACACVNKYKLAHADAELIHDGNTFFPFQNPALN